MRSRGTIPSFAAVAMALAFGGGAQVKALPYTESFAPAATPRRRRAKAKSIHRDFRLVGPFANVGRKHPDYRLHPQKHWENKAARNA